MSEELKPCPFCSRKAIICKPLGEISGWVIRCEIWGCCEKGLGPSLDKKIDLIRLIKAWNKRAKENTDVNKDR